MRSKPIWWLKCRLQDVYTAVNLDLCRSACRRLRWKRRWLLTHTDDGDMKSTSLIRRGRYIIASSPSNLQPGDHSNMPRRKYHRSREESHSPSRPQPRSKHRGVHVATERCTNGTSLNDMVDLLEHDKEFSHGLKNGLRRSLARELHKSVRRDAAYLYESLKTGRAGRAMCTLGSERFNEVTSVLGHEDWKRLAKLVIQAFPQRGITLSPSENGMWHHDDLNASASFRGNPRSSSQERPHGRSHRKPRPILKASRNERHGPRSTTVRPRGARSRVRFASRD